MEDSPFGLDKWMPAMWQVVNCKNGVSSYESHRAVGDKFAGHIEADKPSSAAKRGTCTKTFAPERSPGPRQNKTPVMGILERGFKGESRVRVKVVPTTKKKALQSEVREHVLAGSAIFTDTLKSYEGPT